MKKIILILSFVMSLSSWASNVFVCYIERQGKADKIKFVLVEIQNNTYELSIYNEYLNHDSCRSRWGCEIESELLSKELMELTVDYDRPQYVLETYKGKNAKLEIEDEIGYYTYKIKDPLGVEEEKTVFLDCAL